MAHNIRASDRAAFKRCRRAWDLGSRNRQNHEPIDPRRTVDLDRAVHHALAVYYFPGMWEWNRSIVQSLAHQALDRSLHAQRDDGVDEQAYSQALTRGHALLDAYAAWAPTMDHFTPVLVDIDFEVNIPDPAVPGAALTTPDGDAIRYTDRIDMLAIDENDAYWAVQHRLVTDAWPEQDMLLLDERTVAWCWAWPLFYIDMRVAGTVYNQIRADAGDSGAAPSGVLGQQRMLHRRMYARAVEVPASGCGSRAPTPSAGPGSCAATQSWQRPAATWLPRHARRPTPDWPFIPAPRRRSARAASTAHRAWP